MAIPVFDLELYIATGGPGNGTVRIVNILGFFVDRMGGFHGNDVVGYLINKKEVFDPSKGGVPTGASFIKSVLADPLTFRRAVRFRVWGRRGRFGR